MSEEYLKEQLLEGLKQLEMNLVLLEDIHKKRNLDLSAPYTTNTMDALKVQYVNISLKALKEVDPKEQSE